MRSEGLVFMLLITSAYVGVFAKNHSSRPKLRRSDFPQGFIFYFLFFLNIFKPIKNLTLKKPDQVNAQNKKPNNNN
ncbi:BnaAnng19220D [Brassica napus]|uniref:BnaAnng19220D protein n=1 Tax=Brassica napus TaxID=3708 RepID=A0A078JF65_BRANA|nr:BnaAnng19220D [Brassica napus]